MAFEKATYLSIVADRDIVIGGTTYSIRRSARLYLRTIGRPEQKSQMDAGIPVACDIFLAGTGCRVSGYSLI